MSPPRENAVNETTPLIAAEASADSSTQVDNSHAEEQPLDSDDGEALPIAQIVLLCSSRFTETVIFFSIFPFISQMIQDVTGVAESDVGFYSGLVESILSIAQIFFMIPWGRAADRFGRKPVIFSSLVGLSISCALFGTSQTIWQMIMYRALAGVFSGTMVAVRASISENSTPKTQARAFSYFSFANNMGIFLGPLLGGALSRPADRYPSIFSGISFFKEYPYALPTFTTGAIGVTVCILSALFLKETLQSISRDDINGLPSKPISMADIMKSPGVVRVLLLQVFVMILALGYTAITPVFYFTSVRLGGYGFSEFQISIFIGIAGLSQAIWLLFIFPPLQRRIGTSGVLRLCASAWPIWFFLTPAVNYLRRFELETLFWVFGPTFLVMGSGVAMAFTACQLAINDISPSPQALGTVNAISLTVNSGIRAVVPAIFSSLFATGVKKQIFKGYLVWVVLVVLAVCLRLNLLWLVVNLDEAAYRKTTTTASLDDEDD